MCFSNANWQTHTSTWSPPSFHFSFHALPWLFSTQSSSEGYGRGKELEVYGKHRRVKLIRYSILLTCTSMVFMSSDQFCTARRSTNCSTNGQTLQEQNGPDSPRDQFSGQKVVTHTNKSPMSNLFSCGRVFLRTMWTDQTCQTHLLSVLVEWACLHEISDWSASGFDGYFEFIQ